MRSKVLLTFDVEEFDMPLEYNHMIDINEQMEIGMKGLDALNVILNNDSVQSTLFTTANFALRYPESIKQLAKKHEIASHTYFHSNFVNEHLLESKICLQEISQTNVVGLRMPRMRKVDLAEVKKAGYLYDSSINPTWIPGRYNNLHLSRNIYIEDNLVRIPASVSPILRLPLFWLGFKNYPFQLFKILCKQTLKKDGYLSLYFHPWEFCNLKKYTIPNYTKKIDGSLLLARLETLIVYLQKTSDFITMNDYLIEKEFI